MLDAILRTTLPDNSTHDLTQGREAELRQTAHLLLIERYLAGNSLLMAASGAGDGFEIENQIQRSCHAALCSAKRAMRREILTQQRTHVSITSEDTRYAHCLHPSQRMHCWELPYDSQRQLLFITLQKALRERQLPIDNIELVLLMVEEKISQAEIARRMQVTRQAVHQRIAPVCKYVRSEIEKEEFPLI